MSCNLVISRDLTVPEHRGPFLFTVNTPNTVVTPRMRPLWWSARGVAGRKGARHREDASDLLAVWLAMSFRRKQCIAPANCAHGWLVMHVSLPSD
jgi:hypothetical protein